MGWIYIYTYIYMQEGNLFDGKVDGELRIDGIGMRKEILEMETFCLTKITTTASSSSWGLGYINSTYIKSWGLGYNIFMVLAY